jgi:excisionase family DNA binding protein
MNIIQKYELAGIAPALPQKTETLSPLGLLTKKQAAEALCVSVRTITNWQKRGMIPYLKVGGRCLYPAEKILKSLERNFSCK